MQDTLWMVGVLLVAVACLWYAHMGLREGDAVLVVGGILAAAFFALAALAYWWWSNCVLKHIRVTKRTCPSTPNIAASQS